MSGINLGLQTDLLFVGATRPPMRWGVTYSALLVNVVFTTGSVSAHQEPPDVTACAPDPWCLRTALCAGMLGFST